VTGDSHRPPRSGCAINAVIEVLGDPWSMLVLRDVILGDRRHFRELLHSSAEESRPTSSAAGTSGW
jgi:DNA-binding HxlR family transcriptional regulator